MRNLEEMVFESRQAARAINGSESTPLPTILHEQSEVDGVRISIQTIHVTADAVARIRDLVASEAGVAADWPYAPNANPITSEEQHLEESRGLRRRTLIERKITEAIEHASAYAKGTEPLKIEVRSWAMFNDDEDSVVRARKIRLCE